MAAFRKFDKNGDGVIDWDEFQQVRSRNSEKYAQRLRLQIHIIFVPSLRGRGHGGGDGLDALPILLLDKDL